MRKISGASVCVVGGAGFLGSHLVEHLIEQRQCQVLVIDNLCVGRREFIHKAAQFEHADITQSERHLYKLFKQYRTQFVFNYAAHPYIPESFDRPLHVFSVNATGAIQVINAAQEAGVEAILQVSSAELYGHACGPDPMEGDRITELDEVYPHSTYGAAKAAVDYYCQCAWKERKTPVITLRQFNCVGERETHPYVVPEIISQLERWGRETERRENRTYVPYVRLGNNSTRDFLYAGDQVRIATELLERGQFGEVYNLGSETGIKIYDLAKLLGKTMGLANIVVEEDPARKRPWEIWHLCSDNFKIKSVTCGISEPQNLVPLEESLRRTVGWYRQNGSKWPWEQAQRSPQEQ